MEAIVEYNYVAQEPDELTLRKGDVIKEIKMMVGGWWEGTLRDKRGMFPDNFVKVMESSSTTGSSSNNSGGGEGVTVIERVSLRNGASGRRWCKVLFSYEPCNDDELGLLPQDSIEFLGEVEEGWWKGRLRGNVGVFPSNFVSPPVHEEQDKHKDREKKELCRVLFPYEAANEDELTLAEGEVVTLLSKEAPDKGWWKGELRGQTGLFPDNFVEVIGLKTEHQEQEQWYESSQTSTKTATKHSHQVKKAEKAHVRKSLDIRNIHTDSVKKPTPPSPLSSSPLTCTAGGSLDKKSAGNPSLVSNIKRLVGEGGSNNGNATSNVTLGEEFDGVERGEGAPLLHLTASRAKAPRRRLPSSQHLRHHTTKPLISTSVLPSHSGLNSIILEDKLSNGNAENVLSQIREDEMESLRAKARRIAPWIEELKLTQMERRKSASDRTEKAESKKDKNYGRITAPTIIMDQTLKCEPISEECKLKDKDKIMRSGTNPHENVSGDASDLPAYVPYPLFDQLLERVAVLEEQVHLLTRISEVTYAFFVNYIK